MKHNIRYNVIRVTSASEKTAARVRVEVANEVIRVVLCIEKTISSSQKGVVYIRSRETYKEMATRLDYDHYYSSIVEIDRRYTL